MNQKCALLTLVMLAMTAHAGSALAALPNFSATCPTDIRVKSQGGNVFINGKKATLKTLAPAAYSATNGKVVIGITFDLPASEPTLDYVIKHDRRAHGFCTVHAWSAGKAAALPMAKRADGALQFRQGTILYTLQGDPRIRDESDWNDSDVQNTGPIRLE
ncbi:hypothetical protein ACEUAK_12180 [Aeromonas veronii]|uniref:hypothetical protein n=1 Tax=Aeromonas veronii TaxID=654 RepID=UPI0014313A8B|nr:hypothetical protein [Aeromonas veronii]NJI17998.1 hypothetical protein [Aeromonas veronii]